MGGKSDKPDLPSTNDYIRLANVQSGIGREFMQEQTRANRPDQFSPYGQSIWTEEDGRWRQDIALPEDRQAALESQDRLGLMRSELGESLMGRASDVLGSPLGWKRLSANEVGTSDQARQAAEDAIYSRATSRLDPIWEQREQQTHDRLWNQGLRPGDEAWDAAMSNLGRERNDAYQAAINESVMGGGRESERSFKMDMMRRQQAIAENLRRRGLAINEINSLLGGQQIGMPQLPGFQAAGRAAPPDVMNAARMGTQNAIDMYNADQMGDQSLWSGLTNLGSAAALGYFAFSDRRLKTNIRRVGVTPGGQPVYRYTIFGRDEIGVMADESPPDIVKKHSSGFLMVDYSRIR